MRRVLWFSPICSSAMVFLTLPTRGTLPEVTTAPDAPVNLGTPLMETSVEKNVQATQAAEPTQDAFRQTLV